uniref:Uncharacterized protein n=1 Tax=Oryza punctata TaxID=4537 RepID=A0A0E0KYM2_ORYPU
MDGNRAKTTRKKGSEASKRGKENQGSKNGRERFGGIDGGIVKHGWSQTVIGKRGSHCGTAIGCGIRTSRPSEAWSQCTEALLFFPAHHTLVEWTMSTKPMEIFSRVEGNLSLHQHINPIGSHAVPMMVSLHGGPTGEATGNYMVHHKRCTSMKNADRWK